MFNYVYLYKNFVKNAKGNVDRLSVARASLQWSFCYRILKVVC